MLARPTTPTEVLLVLAVAGTPTILVVLASVLVAVTATPTAAVHQGSRADHRRNPQRRWKQSC